MIAPMLATLGEAPLVDAALVYEPKYDGIRAIADVAARAASVKLWSRLGNDKTTQFPEVVAALTTWARRRSERVVLDGELVALGRDGEPVGFQNLQGRIHVKDEPVAAGDTAYIVFDVLWIGDRDLREEPLTKRRAALESLFARNRSAILRVSEQVKGDGRALYRRALESGWEGLIAKNGASRYRSGKRSPDWCKLKIIHEQEFLVCGWTEPRNTRVYFGALLLGVYEGGALKYAGHTGTGFDGKELARVMARLKPLETTTCPFAERPPSNERPHWVKPELVVQVKFTEWTADQHLRHPVYLGIRDDKQPADVVREEGLRHHHSVTKRIGAVTRGPNDTKREAKTRAAKSAESDRQSNVRSAPTSGRTRNAARRTSHTSAAARGQTDTATGALPDSAIASIVDQLQAFESERRDGTLDLPDGNRLAVTNLHKVFWPDARLTKGDLFRYYAQVAPAILPVLADRPLVMKRFPNGIDAKPFYQHRAPDVPPGVRVETVPSTDDRPQIIGGGITTLMYTCQLAAISQDPWFSRVQSADEADHVALDLDPSDGVSFAQVLDVARWIRDELAALGVFSMPKTSGSRGLHVFVPLAPHTSYEAGLIFSQLVATIVAERHPKHATVERAVKSRGTRVYVDYLQNIEGKTLASAYSARASEYAGVSTPLTWKEVDRGVRREDFTIRTVPARLKEVGDIWSELRAHPGADLREMVDAQ